MCMYISSLINFEPICQFQLNLRAKGIFSLRDMTFLWVLWKQAVLIEERDLISGPMERKAAVKAQPLLDIKESTWERGVPDRGKSCSGNWQLLDAREFDLKTCIHKKWVFISSAHKAALIFFFLIIYIPISCGCTHTFPWLFQRNN